MIKRIELLIHAGAPSSRIDDETYRAQAQAYLVFEGDFLRVSTSTGAEDEEISVAVGGSDSNRDETTNLGDDPMIFLDDTQLAYTALDSQLVTSSLAIPLSRADERRTGVGHASFISEQEFISVPKSSNPPRRGLRLRRTPSPCARSSSKRGWPENDEMHNGNDRTTSLLEHPFGSRDGRLEQSDISLSDRPSQTSYLKLPALDRSTKKRRLDDQVDQCHGSGHTAIPTYLPLSENRQAGVAYVGERPVASTERVDEPSEVRSQESAGGNETTSELPTSYSLSDITSESSRARARQTVSQRSASDPGPRTESLSPTLHRTAAGQRTAEQAGGASLRHPTDESSPHDAVSETVKNAKAFAKEEARAPVEDRRINVEDQSCEAQADLNWDVQVRRANLHGPSVRELSTSIRPHEPSITVDKYTTHVTDSLRFLAEESEIKGHYQPSTVLRDIRPLERGYWLIDTSSWLSQIQVDFWSFLKKLVGDGSAGWGVWCTRGESEESVSPCGPSETSLGTVKVFCWGEIVKHVYLLLYVASKSKVRKLGLRWIDAEGKTIVQMRGRY